MSAKKNALDNLISVATQTEVLETKKEEIKEVKAVEEKEKDVLQEKNIEKEAVEDVKIEITHEQNTADNKYENAFLKKEYGVGEQSFKLPLSIHKQYKLLSAHTGVPISQIIANVLNQFLEENKGAIKKTMKL